MAVKRCKTKAVMCPRASETSESRFYVYTQCQKSVNWKYINEGEKSHT